MIWEKLFLWKQAMKTAKKDADRTLAEYGASVMLQHEYESSIINQAKALLIVWYFLIMLGLVWGYKAIWVLFG